MKTVNFTILAALLFIVGCSPVDDLAENSPVQVQHQYELMVVDFEGHPLEGVKIEYTLKDRETIVESSSYTTASDGFLKKNLIATADPKNSTYKTEFDFTVTKEGYHPRCESLSSDYGGETSDGEKVVQDELIMVRSIDFFDKEFALAVSDTELKTKLLNFLDALLQGRLGAFVPLDFQSVKLVSFKGNQYLQFKLPSFKIYNSNSFKFSKYNIGQELFDDIIRKALSTIDEYCCNSNLFYGYDIIIVGMTQDFADEDATVEPIEFRFLIPESAVKKHMNMDISNQQLLNESVILMDDVRIELRLQ